MLRPARQSDCTVMEAIHATAFTARDAWSRDVFSLQLTLPGVVALLHPPKGLIIARIAADEAEILTLAVIPAARRSGVATRLLGAAARQVAALGARAFFLEVSVRNNAARALYERAGFTEKGRRARYYSDGSDALVLRLDLEPSPGGATGYPAIRDSR